MKIDARCNWAESFLWEYCNAYKDSMEMFMTIDFRDLDNAFTFNNTMRRDLLNNVLHLRAGIFLLNI